MGRYLKNCVWEICLLAALSACLLLNFSQGFYIPQVVAENVPLALITALALSLLLYIGSYNRAAVAALCVLLLAAAAALFLYLRANGIDIVDDEGSGTSVYIYVFAALLIPLLSFLLSRSLAGTGLLFALGALLCGLIDYLGYGVRTWATALFCLAAAALFILRSCRRGAAKSSAVAPRFGRVGLAAALTALSAAALAALVFLLVIRPLDPPTLDISLISRFLDYRIFEATGVAEDYPIPDEMLRETAPPEEQINSDDATEEPNEERPEETETPPAPTEGELPAFQAGASAEDTERLGSVAYGLSVGTVLLLILLAAALAIGAALAIVVRRRKARKRRLLALPPGEQIVALYGFYLEKFGCIGYRRPPAQTAAEYRAFREEQLAPYTAGTLSLAELTETFNAARYGGEAPEEARRAAYWDFYPAFLKNYRRLHGSLRYALRRVSILKSRRI